MCITSNNTYELAALNAALNYICKQDWVEKVQTIKLLPSPPPRDAWMKPEEVKIFFSNFESFHIKVFSYIALYTLSRKTAICELDWDLIDFTNDLIEFNPKDRIHTKKRRVPVPISKNLKPVLLEAYEVAESNHVIEWDGKRVMDVGQGFREHAKRIGMPWVTPHVLRHTGATMMAKEGVPMWDIAGIMGDSLATVTKHYAKHHPDYLRGSVNALDKVYG